MASTFKNAIKPNISTSGSVVYTAPALTTATMIGLSVANTDVDDTLYITATITDVSAGFTASLGSSLMVPVRGSLIIVGGDQKIVLEPGDYITLTASATGLDAVASVLEVS